jgi:hypothetical protein
MVQIHKHHAVRLVVVLLQPRGKNQRVGHAEAKVQGVIVALRSRFALVSNARLQHSKGFASFAGTPTGQSNKQNQKSNHFCGEEKELEEKKQIFRAKVKTLGIGVGDKQYEEKEVEGENKTKTEKTKKRKRKKKIISSATASQFSPCRHHKCVRG